MRTRPRQADLSANDRIDLILSPDRDYTSYYRLSIDYRGWVNSWLWRRGALAAGVLCRRRCA